MSSIEDTSDDDDDISSGGNLPLTCSSFIARVRKKDVSGTIFCELENNHFCSENE